MATRKKTKKRAKPHYVRTKKRKGAGSTTLFRRGITVALLLIILAGIVIGVIAGFNWIERKLFSENPHFEIQHLMVSTDGKLKEAFIRENIELTEGNNLFAASLEDIERDLVAVSTVESVHLERKLPHTLIVKVKERMPVARVSELGKEDRILTVDRQGHVLPYRLSAVSLPLIKGVDASLRLGYQADHRDVETALEIIAICNSRGYLRDYARIESMDVSSKYDFIEMRLEEGIRVRMPRYSLKAKLRDLDTLLAIERGKGERVKTVDLTVDSAKVKVPVSYY